MSPLSFVGPTAGLVASFNRPGGNLTGVTVITNTLWPKRIELLRELLPTTPLIAVLVNPTNLAHLSATRELNDYAICRRDLRARRPTPATRMCRQYSDSNRGLRAK